MNTVRRPTTPVQETPTVLFERACLVMGSYTKAERWFESNHPMLGSSPKNAQGSPAKAQQLGALMEALAKGWPL
ncbi:hypothetical protein GN316_17955 [Xylophilus sp. Kf1]|nr:hypothetical protein [Xylophilus sp. Kf1]